MKQTLLKCILRKLQQKRFLTSTACTSEFIYITYINIHLHKNISIAMYARDS